MNGDLEAEPIINDLLVQLISLAVVSKSQKENIGEKSFVLISRSMWPAL